MDKAKHQIFYEATVGSYRRIFSSMDELGRLSFFVSMDESAILGFIVSEGESVSDAEERHEVKLLAIAEALGSLPCTAREQRIVEDLRTLAATSAKRRAIAALSPTPDPDLEHVQRGLDVLKNEGLP